MLMRQFPHSHFMQIERERERERDEWGKCVVSDIVAVISGALSADWTESSISMRSRCDNNSRPPRATMNDSTG